MTDAVLREPAEDRVAFRDYILAILKELDVPAFVRPNIAGVLAEKLAPLVCHCGDGHPESYEGPQAHCPVHGVVVAYNELMRVKTDTDRINRAAQASLEGLLVDAQRESFLLRSKLVEIHNQIQSILDGTE